MRTFGKHSGKLCRSLAALGASIALLAGAVALPAEAEETTAQDTAAATTAAAVEYDYAHNPSAIRLSFVGDCTLGTDVHFGGATFPVYYNKYGPDYFLLGVRSFFEQDDLTVVNLEGTLTTSTSRANKTFAFKGDPSYTAILTGSSVEVCNFANNHNHDYGNQSFTDTTAALESAGIAWVCDETVSLLEVKGVKVGIAGIYELGSLMGCDSLVKADIEKLQSLGADVIVVEFHWGIERASVPDSNQVRLAHNAIDYGADLVVGSHPHVLQGIETYNGKQIVYSMGNFCFGGNSNPSDKDTMLYQMNFQLSAPDETGHREITATAENVIPCRLSSVSSYNNYQPTTVTGDEARRIISKIQQRSNAAAAKYGTTADQIVLDPAFQ